MTTTPWSRLTPGCAVVATPLVPMELSWGPQGLRRARFLADGHTVPKKTLPTVVEALAQRIQAHLAGDPQTFLDVPLDLEGTAFQMEVWKHVRQIPSGVVESYGDIAAALGRRGAARAIGRAVATNPVPLLVPCHRVVASSGALTGFTALGGLELKARLLALEGRPCRRVGRSEDAWRLVGRDSP